MSVGVLYVLSAIGSVSERWFDVSIGEVASLDARSFASPSNAAGRVRAKDRPNEYLSLEGF